MKRSPSARKLRGGYYTPGAIAEFLADWAIQEPSARVLEPSCGDGSFLKACAARLRSLGAARAAVTEQITAVELVGDEAAKAEQAVASVLGHRAKMKVLRGDFFTRGLKSIGAERFDAVLGNPPFIRYQNFTEPQREAAFSLLASYGLRPNRLTNAWLPFVVLGVELLKPIGRLAMVIPAELLQVNYAAELRQYLSDSFARLTVFTFKRLLFAEIQQEVVLLCGERDGGRSSGIRTIELNSLADLVSYQHTPFEHEHLKPLDHSRDKWTQYFLTTTEIRLLRSMKKNAGLLCLGQLADVDVGVVTGLNEFFVLGKSDVDKLDAEEFVSRLVARSGHLRGIIFSAEDWNRNVEGSLPAYLLSVPNLPLKRLPMQLRDYIAGGEAKGWNLGFKCRIREPWYSVPSVWIPDGFMLRQIHDFPRIIVNKANATSTDTIHRVRVHLGVDIAQLAAAAVNSLTFAFAEVVGRSYGGGVLELEPGEAEELPIPYSGAANLDVSRVDSLLREGEYERALDYSDEIVLIRGLGISRADARRLRCIWQSLRDRRAGRKVRPTREDIVDVPA